MKKVIAIILGIMLMLAIAIPTAAATTKAGQTEKTKATVKIECVTSPTYTTAWWDTFLKKIEKDNPGITMSGVYAPGTERISWMKIKYAAGDVPDIITEPAEYGAMPGALAEVPADLLSNFDPATITKNNGKVLMIPAYIQLKSQVYYNKKLFADAGISKEPTTWQAFVDTCAKLKAKNIAPLMACKETWFNAFGYATAVLQPDIIDSDANFVSKLKTGAAKFNSPTIVNSTKRWQELFTKGYYVKGYLSYSYTQAVDEFFKGSSAMIINGSWMAPQIDGLTTKLGFDVGIFPVPQTTGVKSIGAGSGYWAVFKSSKVQTAAFNVAKYILGGNKEAYASFLKNDNLMAATKVPVTYECAPMTALFNKNALKLKKVMDFAGLSGDVMFPSGFQQIYNDNLSFLSLGQDVSASLNTLDSEYKKLNKK